MTESFYDENEALQAGIDLDPDDSDELEAPPIADDADTEWQPPIGFDVKRPTFPAKALPNLLQDYAQALAVETQTPLGLTAMLTLAAVSAASAGKIIVNVRQGWSETVNLYIAVALPPGNRKSQVCRTVLRPLEAFEQTEAVRMAPNIADARGTRAILEQQLENAKLQLRKAPGGQQRIDAEAEVLDLNRQLADHVVPTSPCLVLDDVTQEKLADVLKEQGGHVSIISAEGGGPFELMAGRYTKNGSANLDIYLKGHAGDHLRVARKSSDAVNVARPTITMGLALQPEVIRSLATIPGLRGRGLLARMLFVIPDSQVGRREISPPALPNELRRGYESAIDTLLRIETNRGPSGDLERHTISLEDDALQKLEEFMRWLEPKLAPGAELGSICDWAGKLAGAVVRISGLFHMIEHASADPLKKRISGATLRNAVLLAKYLIAHALAAFVEMGADSSVDDAKALLVWIKRYTVSSFTKRDAFNALRSRFKRVGELEPALEQLSERGHIRLRPFEETHGPGRKPSPLYDVNPLIHDKTESN